MSGKTVDLKATVDGKEQIFTGRFIGFIKDDEFNALVQNPEKVGGKLESKATQDLLKVAAKFDNLNGHRLCLVVKKVDGRNVIKKTLYITEALGMIDSVVPRQEKGKWDQGPPGKWVPTPGKITIQTGTEDNIVLQESN